MSVNVPNQDLVLDKKGKKVLGLNSQGGSYSKKFPFVFIVICLAIALLFLPKLSNKVEKSLKVNVFTTDGRLLREDVAHVRGTIYKQGLLGTSSFDGMITLENDELFNEALSSKSRKYQQEAVYKTQNNVRKKALLKISFFRSKDITFTSKDGIVTTKTFDKAVENLNNFEKSIVNIK